MARVAKSDGPVTPKSADNLVKVSGSSQR